MNRRRAAQRGPANDDDSDDLVPRSHIKRACREGESYIPHVRAGEKQPVSIAIRSTMRESSSSEGDGMKTDASVKTHERVQLQRKQSRNLERMFAAFGRSRVSLKTLVILIVAMAALSGLATLVALLVLVDFNFSRLAALASGSLAISEAQSELIRLQAQLALHEHAILCSDVPIDPLLTLPTMDLV